MRILACHNYYQQRGGEDQFFEDEVQLLSMHGHDVLSHTVENDSINNQSLLRVAGQSLWNFESARKIKELIATHKPDVMHVVNTFPLISHSIFKAARQANIPVVASVQNYRMFCAQSMCYRDGKACEACLGKIPWRAVKHACYRDSRVGSTVVAGVQIVQRRTNTWNRYIDVICVASEFSRAKLVKAGISDDQFMIKPNFIFDDPGQREGRAGYAVFVGRLAGEKGINTVVDAWQQQGVDLPLKIIGDGPEFDWVQQQTATNDNIEMLGRLPNSEISEWVGNAACLIFPSTGYESLPKTLIESLAVGTPVIGSAIGSIPEVVRDGETGYLYPAGDAVALAAAVNKFFDCPQDWPRLRARCRQDFLERYTAEQNHVGLLRLYTEAIRRRRGEAAASLAISDYPKISRQLSTLYQQANQFHG